MTETNKTISGASGEQPAAEKRTTATKSASSKASATQKNGPAKTAAAKPPQRDAYDDFLDEMDRAEKAAGTQSRAASSKKTGAAKSPAASPRKAASGKQAAASKKTDPAKKQAPSSKKVAYQDDLLAAWDELERESRLRKDTRRAATRSTEYTAPRGKRSAAGSSADSPRPRAAAGTPRKRPADKNPGAPGNRSSAAKARRAPARHRSGRPGA